MKYILPILLISISSCAKNNDKPNTTSSGSVQIDANNTTWQTYYSSPSIPNIRWGTTLTISDTNQIVKVTLYRVNPSYVAFEINKPISKTYSITQPGYKCPSYNDKAYFYYEWSFKDGSKKQKDTFQVYE